VDLRSDSRTEARAAAPRSHGAAAPRGLRLGERVRQLRVAAGFTQSELAGERFSKEYISQIERGKTRPTSETVAWLAERLGVETEFLQSGVSSEERDRAEAVIARGEAHLSRREYDAAIAAFQEAAGAVASVGASDLRVQALAGGAWARMQGGDARAALPLLADARTLVEAPEFDDVDRADVLFRFGVARYLLSSIATAQTLLGEALALAERSELTSDLLRSRILLWRSRCHRRQRDFEGARDDVERALELAEAQRDPRVLGEAYFQASLIAERDGSWIRARSYAERAKERYEEIDDALNVGRLLNNLGNLDFLLGHPEAAVERLNQALGVAASLGSSDEEATAVSSLAQVHLRTGSVKEAEHEARRALELLGNREDRLDEIGNAGLVLGRALLEQDRLDEAEVVFAEVEASFDQLSSGSHKAAAWMAQGDLAAKRGESARAADLYRRAAETLQDFRF
jgi:tetratricopeptide (TPR) repeat protein